MQHQQIPPILKMSSLFHFVKVIYAGKRQVERGLQLGR